MEVMNIKCERILADPENNISRTNLCPADCKDIAGSIETHGLKMPVTVRPVYNKPLYDYGLVMGFRRFTAVSANLGLPTIPAFIVECTVEEGRIMNLVENLQRQDLTFFEQAKGLALAFPPDTNRKVIAQQLGRSDAWVKDRWLLRELPKCIRDQVEQGLLGASEVNIILQQDKDQRKSVASKLRAGKKAGRAIKDIQRSVTSRKPHRSKKEVKKMMTLCMGADKMDAVHMGRYCSGEISDSLLLELLDIPKPPPSIWDLKSFDKPQ